MTLSDVAIQRPILTWMMTLALIVFGTIGFLRLGVDQFPNLDFPVLTVQAVLEGATPEGMEEDVTDILEEYLNTISGVRSIRSTSYQGAAILIVEFELGKNLDVAAQDVRDKVSLARVDLPPELDPPVVGTFDPNDMPVLWIPLDSQRSVVATSEAVRRQISPYLQTIPGVAGVAMFGRRDRNIRIWLDGDELRARGLAAGDVLAALQREHVEMPGGSVESARVDYSVKTDAEFRTVAEMETLVVAHRDGAPVLLRDVARVEDGAEDPAMVVRYNGEPSVGMGIRKQSGGNTVAIVDEVLSRLDQVAAVLPAGIRLHATSGYIDFSKGVREAVSETEFALLFGALLAVFTVWVFLRRARPTFIIALAIPVSLIATFGLVYVAGFTLNTMTLLGMALAVGVVIDDAIVVLENIERHRERGESGWDAASKGTREIAFAATAATFSVAAVFLPVLFVEGLVGSFLRDFGLTVAGSVLLSLFVALTLTPMLAARMPPPSERQHGSVYHRLEQGFEWIEERYRRILDWTLAHRLATVLVALASFLGACGLSTQLDSEFFPAADEGIFFARLEAAPGTSLEATDEYLKADEQWFLRQPELAGLFSAAGSSGGGNEAARQAETNMGMVFGTLKPRDERERSVHELIADARAELSAIPGRKLRIFNPSEMITAGANQGSFEVEILGNLELVELDRLAQEMIRRLDALGGFVDLSSSLKLGLPEVRIVPDREKAAALGVDARTVAQAIRVMVGGQDVGIFKEAGRRYDIRMRLDEEDRRDPAQIGQLYVRTGAGEVVELRNLVRIETGAAPSAITRTNRQRSVTIGANLADGRKLGPSIEDARRIADEILPEGVALGLSGQAQAMQEGAGQLALALGLGILVIYMVLAAQFESLVHPLTVMLALPLAMVGAILGLLVTGHTLNLFSMIGILLLFGLVTKNSILLVDYANQLRREGMDKLTAMRTAAPVRLRPVLMTAISMIFGVLPAAIGIGPGSETRAPMAVASAAGMFSSMLLTLLVVPVFYLLFDDAADTIKRAVSRIGSQAREASAQRGEAERSP
ncbi:MAG: efflux RND transporter permease subunit [Deltaproteobacteria bacterium]|nr:efflux RND transporter permease subunit [Deltaproteobacteria bacterium]